MVGDDAFSFGPKGRGTSDNVKPSRPKAKKTPPSKTAIDRVSKKVTNQLQDLGRVISIVEPYDGAVIFENAEQFTDGWMAVAEDHPGVLTFFDNLTTASAFGAALAGTMAIALPILVHHGIVPPILGAKVPENVMPFKKPAASRKTSTKPQGNPFDAFSVSPQEVPDENEELSFTDFVSDAGHVEI